MDRFGETPNSAHWYLPIVVKLNLLVEQGPLSLRTGNIVAARPRNIVLRVRQTGYHLPDFLRDHSPLVATPTHWCKQTVVVLSDSVLDSRISIAEL